jgi:hypothetical protein
MENFGAICIRVGTGPVLMFASTPPMREAGKCIFLMSKLLSINKRYFSKVLEPIGRNR